MLQDHIPEVTEAPERQQVEGHTDEFASHGKFVLRPSFLQGIYAIRSLAALVVLKSCLGRSTT